MFGKFRFSTAAAVILLLLLASRSYSRPAYPVIQRVSVSSSGAEAKGACVQPAVSETGRYTAFVSAASNLVSGDTNSQKDVFVHDRQTDVTERVSISSGGAQADGDSHSPSISFDGRYVAFTSDATNLVPDDTNAERDAFVYDRTTDTIERVSISSAEAQGNEGVGLDTAISADGRYVVFNSLASNMVVGDTNSAVDTFVRDRTTGETQRVSVSSSGLEQDDDSLDFDINADGQFIAFSSWATNLVPDDTNGRQDVFVHDRKTGETLRISVTADGSEGSSTSGYPSISADGQLVAFSTSSILDDDDINGAMDVYVYSMEKGGIQLVSLAADGSQGDGSSLQPSISGDGRMVAFRSHATNLVTGDSNGFGDIFCRNIQTGEIERMSVSTTGEQANAYSQDSDISADGRYVAFSTTASNLVPDDVHGTEDVFLRASDSVRPGVTINQSSTQADPTPDSPVHFQVRFSEPVTGFTFGELILSGTAHPTTALVSGSNDEYTVAVSGMTAAGTVTAAIWEGAAADWWGNQSADSTSTDNTVSYDPYPHNVSVDPSGGTLPSEVSFSIQTVCRDLGGASDIRRSYLLINDSLGQANAVFLYYDHVNDRVYLKNDANTSWGTGYAPGADIVLENSQCYVYVQQIVVHDALSELIINWRIRLKAAHASRNLNSYMYVQDIGGLTDGWERMGLYYNVKPQVVSMSPDSVLLPTGTQMWLYTSYSDPNGSEDIRKCYFLVCEGFSQTNAVFLYYDKVANRIYLKNDANTSWGTGVAPGTDDTLENSQCIAYPLNTGVSVDGDNVQVIWSLELKPSMADRNLYSWMYVADLAGLHDGWKKMGTHFTPVAPTSDSVTPNSGRITCGVPYVFTTQYTDDNGADDIYQCYFQMGRTGSLANAVCVMYDAKLGKVFLRNDANTSWGTGVAPGTALTLENSQCTVDVSGVSLSPGGDVMTIDWTITLKPVLVGVLLGQRMYCRDNEWLNSTWKLRGYVRGQ